MKATVHACLYAILSSSALSTECLAAHNPPTNYVCTYATQVVTKHLIRPSICVTNLSVGGPYALTGTNVDISVSGSAVPVSTGKHEIVTSFLPCKFCGSTNGLGPYFKTNDVLPEIYTNDWTLSPVGSKVIGVGQSFSGTKSVAIPGRYELAAKFTGYRSDCSKCTCDASASTNCTVYQLTFTEASLVSSNLWVGLDRTDDGPTNQIRISEVKLVPDDPATNTWEIAGVCILTNTVGKKTEYWTMDKEACSTSYLDQKLTGKATVTNPPPGITLSVSTNFTVVKVDVSLAGLVETNEETVGAFLAYQKDANGVMPIEGTNSMTGVSITCTPGNLPTSELIAVEFPSGSLFEKIGLTLVEAQASYPACEISSKQFFLHGHAVSKGLRADSIKATHTTSEAVDMVKFTVYELTLTNTLWLGLDRTDVGTNKVGIGTANLKPSAYETYAWKLGASSSACFLTNMVGKTTEYWTKDKEASSKHYLDQLLTATATVSNASPVFSISASTNFTVVKVEVTIPGLVENNEEAVGGFVQYHYDFPEYTNWHSGLKLDSGFQFIEARVTVTPKNLPPGDDLVVLSYEGEECFTNAVFVLEGGYYIPAQTHYRIGELPDVFYIHAHAKDGTRTFRAVHTTSKATDLVKVTNVDVDIDIDSDFTSGFGGPNDTVFEDWIEDGVHAVETNKPLKFVVFNDYYRDTMTGMPGYVDIKMDAPTGPVAQNLLIPVKFNYPAMLPGVDTNTMTVTFAYAGWDPADITSEPLPNGKLKWPVSGKMRLWKKQTGRNPTNVLIDANGDYIPAGVEIKVSTLKGQTDFYLEGVNPGETVGQDEIKATLKFKYGTAQADMDDFVRCTVIRAALDVDTFNDSGMAADTHSPGQGEDHYEDLKTLIGKGIEVNNKDKDGDGIVDYLDGFDFDPGKESDNVNTNEQFVPMVFALPANIDYSNVTVRVTYQGAAPKAGENSSGKIRIWTRKGKERRSKEDFPYGDYLPSGTQTYKATDLGFTGGVHQVTFYVEAVRPSAGIGDEATRVLFEARMDERNAQFIAADAVRFTAFKADLIYNDPLANKDLPEESKPAPNEEDPGGFILLNDNDNDNMQGIDKDRATTEPELSDADPDLKKVKLSLTPVPNWGKVTLTVPPTLLVWENAKKKSLFTARSWDLAVPSEKTAFEALTVTGIWLEGIETGVGDLELKYEEICRDKVRINVVNLDLDVDNDTQLGGVDDGVARYLPGYKGANAVLSTGTTFLNPAYQGQAMTVVLDGIGTNAGFDEIVFVISGSSSRTGFCENATDDRITGAGKEQDFSFQEIGDKITNTVTTASAAPDGKIEADRTWSRLWCKDYGGSCKIKVFLKKGGVVKCELEELKVPLDEDVEMDEDGEIPADGLPDLYEKQQLVEWKAQFKLPTFNTNDLAFFNAASEQPATNSVSRPPCAAAGDGLTAAQEYRGYILDGGVNNFAGGHKRLTFARKNLLVEVMEMPGITDVANNNANTNAQTYTLSSALAPVCDLYRHDTRGVPIEMYWVRHDIDRGPSYTYTNNVVVTNAYYYQGFLNYDTTGTNGISGGMYIHQDGVLKAQLPDRYDELFNEHRSGKTQAEAFGRHHDPRLSGFLKLMMVSRMGYILKHSIKGPFPYFNAPGQNAIAYMDINVPNKHLQGARISINGTSEEGTIYMPRSYTTAEFMQMVEYCTAHEMGHLIIQDRQGDGWDLQYHFNVPSGLMYLGVPRPEGITAVSFQDGEIQAINLPTRASAE